MAPKSMQQKQHAESLMPTPDSFEQVVRRYQRPVHNLCLRMLADPAQAEDVAQETFLRAYRNLHRYDPTRPFATWLLAIAAHRCIDHLRKRQLVFARVDEQWDLPDPSPGPEATCEQHQMKEAVVQMLWTLTALDRAAVVLRFWHELSYEELSQVLHLPVSNVKSRLHRAKRRMASQWAGRVLATGLVQQPVALGNQ
jgi:RNA polymerase sigma-70 factor (ECF subfamily)